MTTLYGIKNCDTVKKARSWLDDHNVTYAFHDFRTDGIDLPLIEQFTNHVSWDALLNKRSTTWRQLSDDAKTNIDSESATALFIANPTLIKRPVLVTKQAEQTVHIGFKAENYSKIFAA